MTQFPYLYNISKLPDKKKCHTFLTKFFNNKKNAKCLKMINWKKTADKYFKKKLEWKKVKVTSTLSQQKELLVNGQNVAQCFK